MAKTYTLRVRQIPNPWAVTQGMDIFEGSDGFMYDEHDIAWLTSKYGEPKQRKTKYGITYYFGKGGT